jgi:hypothetical protein
VPVAVVPLDLWNSAKLNNSLKDIDHADEQPVCLPSVISRIRFSTRLWRKAGLSRQSVTRLQSTKVNNRCIAAISRPTSNARNGSTV